MELNKIYNGDTLETVKTLDDESVDCVITSPPYYQLRDYGWTGQWGLEKTYQEYLDNMIALMSELKRVLKPTGTMWINLGDSYMNNSSYSAAGRQGFNNDKIGMIYKSDDKIKQKSLMLIPHRFAIRCVDELGLILRNDVIWAKRNGMPESVTDRFSKKHEFFFFFVKQQKYYFDLDGVRDKRTIFENRADSVVRNRLYGYDSKANNPELNPSAKNKIAEYDYNKHLGVSNKTTLTSTHENGKNPGDVSDFWDIPTQPSSDKHYATFNTDLIDKPIIAGCPEGGVILDPFCGTGTTLLRAEQLNRKTIGIDGSPEYCEIAEKKLTQFRSQLKLSL